ncbi:hypothetical protein [Planktothricoides raciborskii]|uniref:Uncharacterized protein n=1 Tax=Planktothricoides raciborskii GIHE-MW2 TaxID=2792601 RepID=A0AAU8JKD3_9CYAN
MLRPYKYNPQKPGFFRPSLSPNLVGANGHSPLLETRFLGKLATREPQSGRSIPVYRLLVLPRYLLPECFAPTDIICARAKHSGI